MSLQSHAVHHPTQEKPDASGIPTVLRVIAIGLVGLAAVSSGLLVSYQHLVALFR